VAGCGGSSDTKSGILDPDRGGILSAPLAAALGKAQVAGALQQMGLGDRPAPYDIHFHRVIYRTVGVNGDTVTASGMLAFPRGTSGPLPMISYQHGTSAAKQNVPSNTSYEEFLRLAAVACSSGYAVAAADYLGLGHSAGIHPYLHASTEATACLDMIRASREVCRELGILLNSQLFLAGYSQGGHATMALHRLIEGQHSDEFTVTASAPAAGPYDLSGTTLDAALATPSANTPRYLFYLLVSYETVYDLFSSFSQVFQPPYDTLARRAAAGELSLEEALGQIGSGVDLSAMLQPSFVQALASDPDHPVRARLRENDLHDWHAIAPIRLYHSTSDQEVPYQNSVVAQAALTARGSDVLLVPLTGDHVTASGMALLQTLEWFDTLVQ
jgi:predicted esterase